LPDPVGLKGWLRGPIGPSEKTKRAPVEAGQA